MSVKSDFIKKCCGNCKACPLCEVRCSQVGNIIGYCYQCNNPALEQGGFGRLSECLATMPAEMQQLADDLDAEF